MSADLNAPSSPPAPAPHESEARLRALISASSDAVYRMSPDWRELRQLQGRAFIADTDSPNAAWLEKYLLPEDQPRVRAAIAAALRDGRAFELEHRVIRADGSTGWTLSRAVPVLDAAGAVIEWLGTASDITERKRAETLLAESQTTAERQRRLYEAILTNTPDLAYVWGLDHRFVYANKVLLQMWGRSWDEAIGRNCLELGYPDWHAAMHDREIEQVIATRQTVRGEVPFNGAFGLRIYEYILVPVIGDSGEVEAVAGTTRDVTDARATEAALKLQAERVQLALDAGAIIGTWVWDIAADRFTADERFCQVFGLDPAEGRAGLPLRAVTAAIHPADRAGVNEAIERAMQQGGRYSEQYRVRRGEGYRWIEASGHVERGADGVARRFPGVLLDVEERRAVEERRREAEQALRRHREELERLVEARTAALLREVEERRRAEEALRQGEKLQAIGQLTGGIAHDFNNILQVVASGVSLLAMPALREAQRAAVLEGMGKAAENARELTGRLLAFARRQALQPEAFDLNARIAGMAHLLRSTLGPRIRIETDLLPGLWPVMADPSRLEAALLNLAANARDAMLPEGGRLLLTTGNATLDRDAQHAAGDYVFVSVRDDGKGMPPAVLARVFEPFFTTKGPAKGTGLGLAQVHGFVLQSGGDVQIESHPGAGTVVTLHLPRAGHAVAAPVPAAPAESSGAAIARRAGRTVLVVDDNDDVAHFAASLLQGLGYATRRAGDAAAALAMVAAEPAIDAVFSDVVMPGEMDGLQLAARLRQTHPRLALLLASGYSEVLAEHDGPAAAEVLRKPYHLDELAAALDRAFAAVER
ncbi:PAS domain-containing protein [Roseomonas sp. USHLN139]|uniref:PAS domain-containing protein n=1 Tax=Roseomonas sp. USHLN139 TaxID=3081298 RepID=UPI003B01E2EF